MGRTVDAVKLAIQSFASPPMFGGGSLVAWVAKLDGSAASEMNADPVFARRARIDKLPNGQKENDTYAVMNECVAAYLARGDGPAAARLRLSWAQHLEHFGYANAFASLYPEIAIHPERVLVISGRREELVCSGASTTWHDLVLYLIARYAGATMAQDVARAFALQWHQDGLTPYIVFEGKRDHGDGEILGAQDWLLRNFAVAHPVEATIKRSKLAERTFKRRFVAATGLTPMEYVQRLRIEDAKRRLERTEEPADTISWRVGYEDPAFFRRLFKRVTGMAPGAYRKRFRIPDFARPA